MGSNKHVQFSTKIESGCECEHCYRQYQYFMVPIPETEHRATDKKEEVAFLDPGACYERRRKERGDTCHGLRDGNGKVNDIYAVYKGKE